MTIGNILIYATFVMDQQGIIVKGTTEKIISVIRVLLGALWKEEEMLHLLRWHFNFNIDKN